MNLVIVLQQCPQGGKSIKHRGRTHEFIQHTSLSKKSKLRT